MVKTERYWLLITLFFGLPFLALSDLFPFHRFGMFATHPQSEQGWEKIELESFKDGTWKHIESGNAYMDFNYLPQMASRVLKNAEKETELGKKLALTLLPKPDSIRIKHTAGKTIFFRIIFPEPAL